MKFPPHLVLRDILLQFVLERGLTDPQHSCRQKLVAVELRNRAQDGLLLQFRHGQYLGFAVASI